MCDTEAGRCSAGSSGEGGENAFSVPWSTKVPATTTASSAPSRLAPALRALAASARGALEGGRRHAVELVRARGGAAAAGDVARDDNDNVGVAAE